MEKVKKFIGALREEKEGFSFGNPWRYDKGFITCVVPILRDLKKEPKYLTLKESKNVEIRDTGMINKVLIINKGDIPVFVRMGELLRGDTQERTSVMSRVILPGAKEEIDVVCIHESKGIHAGVFFESDGYAPAKDSLFANSIYKKGKVDQSESWAADRLYSKEVHKGVCTIEKRKLRQTVRSDDLTSMNKEVRRIYGDMIQKVPLVENQAGMAIIDKKGLLNLECFDLHASWRVVSEAIAGKEALSLSERDESDVFEYKPEKAKETIKKVLGKEFSEKVLYKTQFTETVALDCKDYTGEAVTIADEVIHLLVTRK